MATKLILFLMLLLPYPTWSSVDEQPKEKPIVILTNFPNGTWEPIYGHGWRICMNIAVVDGEEVEKLKACWKISSEKLRELLVYGDI